MVEITTSVVEKLNTVLTTAYELFLDSKTPVPCISYQCINNSETEQGNTIGYSSCTYRIKVWARTVQDIVSYSQQIDDALAELGRWERVRTNDLTCNNLICRIMDYKCLLLETYNTTR